MTIGISRNLNEQKIIELFLKELRIKSGLRQIDIASALGVQQSMVSKYEVGERRLDILEIRNICKLFGLSLEDFVKDLEMRIEKSNEAG